jgi:hypothetical protein
MGVVFERDGDPWTWTLHVRARTEGGARRLVAETVGAPHAVYACQPSDPLLRVADKEEVVATYGPYRRSWEDRTIAHLEALLRQ